MCQVLTELSSPLPKEDGPDFSDLFAGNTKAELLQYDL